MSRWTRRRRGGGGRDCWLCKWVAFLLVLLQRINKDPRRHFPFSNERTLECPLFVTIAKRWPRPLIESATCPSALEAIVFLILPPPLCWEKNKLEIIYKSFGVSWGSFIGPFMRGQKGEERDDDGHIKMQNSPRGDLWFRSLGVRFKFPLISDKDK